MSRLEPNALLALSTGVALALLLMTASLFGEPGNTVKYLVSAALCAGAFVLLNGRVARMMNRPEAEPMVRPDAPRTALWAGLFPLIVIGMGCAPVFFPGHDYGLLVIIAAVIFGLTIDSAIRARRR
ncbi:hypothetical protein [Brevundimonas sp. SORGH_AS_0993]|uniref:hypothetical protein n=1 Tax=Brevundimonas sp. SORGH_AS_0993 TaxID=3041794 RepID=UPI00278795C5|nr:hypothetical protein [Brevundimonas sp. SORGH_AS_0993]MDQ1153502.1 hypothetical protein [Brevundimonas sp. SORGH_AS_0993]